MSHESRSPHVHYVLVATELVDQLIAAPSQPVTIRIVERRETGELLLEMTRHDCRRMEKEETIFGLPVVYPDRN